MVLYAVYAVFVTQCLYAVFVRSVRDTSHTPSHTLVFLDSSMSHCSFFFVFRKLDELNKLREQDPLYQLMRKDHDNSKEQLKLAQWRAKEREKMEMAEQLAKDIEQRKSDTWNNASTVGASRLPSFNPPSIGRGSNRTVSIREVQVKELVCTCFLETWVLLLTIVVVVERCFDH